MDKLKSLTELVNALTILPGIGKRTAEHMVYYLLQRKRKEGLLLASTLTHALNTITHCTQCRDFSEKTLCPICANEKRNQGQLCIVESSMDIYTIEKTGTYFGRYFNLIGHLSPLDGIGPQELGIHHLKQLIINQPFQEIIIATNATLEGEATANYLAELVRPYTATCTRIAQGIPSGGELEHLSINTVAQAIIQRTTV